MGLKRRGTGRRQVLNIDDVQDAPRKTWQSKYLQICVDHNKKRQMEVDRTSHVVSGTASNPLSGLVGQYRSDSDSEDETVAQKQELNDQVSVFLKEIQTIAPASSAAPPPAAEPAPASVLTPSLPLVPSSASMPVPAYAASDLAALPPEGAHSVTGSEFRAGCYPWQVCYDVDTGYPYYWNMETNEVTWEAPEDVRTYLNHYWMQQMAAGTYPMHHNYLPEQNIYNQDECSEVIAGNNIIETITPKDYFPKKCKPHYEETEYEKIEMITSYGPESDESEDETTVKKPKIEDIDSSEYTSHMIGPLPADGINCNFRSTNKKVKQLSPSDHRYSDSLVSCISALQQEEDQSEGPVFEGSSLLSNDVPDMGPPGEEGSDISYPPEPSYSNECDIISEKKTASEVEKDSISVDTDYAEQKETAKDSSCTNTIEGDDMDQDETIILTRICNQARILKELGGEIPDEVQHLIEPFQKENQEIDVNCSDNIIDTNTAADVEASSSAKTNSFALIAGYGNDSDGEEDKKGGNGRQHLNNHTNSDPIFPIINYKNHITTEKNTNVEERALNILISSEPTVEPKQMKRKKRLDISSVGAIVKGQGDNISAGSTSCLNIHVSTANAGSYSVVSSSKSTSVSDSAASEHTRAEKNEVEVSSDTNCGSKSTSNSTSVADKSATTPFISSYDSDASYGERRGFGFPSSSVNGSETAPDTFETRFVKDSEDKTNVNSKMINFIKAETLNPTTDSEVKTSSPGDDEKLKINDECDKIQEHLNEMSELINEKVTFLSEGKEPVSSLQLLTTQYKTLAEAWEVGALCESYWNQWLEGTLDELARLEEAAAPAGWSCEWCRIYKRYFYRNINNGKMQWEYPKSDDIVDLCKQAPPPPPPPPTCSSPSPLPPVQPSSTSPPQILGCDDNVKQRPVKKKKIEGTKGISKHLGEIEEIGVIDISESPVSEAPESQTSQTDPVFGQLGELLPPNVDLSDTQNVVEKPQEQDLSDIDGVEMGTEDEICEITNTIPENTIEPRKQDLLSPAVIAKPPAKASLHDELDSFYSDLANLEKAGVIPSATEEYLCEQDIIQQPAEQMEAIVHDKSVDSENSSKSSDMVLTEVKKKKKQPKLAPGLSLKKKGVSSLVAKWQQVQQEVRRDYKNIDSKDSGIQN